MGQLVRIGHDIELRQAVLLELYQKGSSPRAVHEQQRWKTVEPCLLRWPLTGFGRNSQKKPGHLVSAPDRLNGRRRFATRIRPQDDVVSQQSMQPPLRVVFELAQAVTDCSAEVSRLSDAVEREFGPATRADVALTLALSPFFPALKRALGVHARECLRPEGLLQEE